MDYYEDELYRKTYRSPEERNSRKSESRKSESRDIKSILNSKTSFSLESAYNDLINSSSSKNAQNTISNSNYSGLQRDHINNMRTTRDRSPITIDVDACLNSSIATSSHSLSDGLYRESYLCKPSYPRESCTNKSKRDSISKICEKSPELSQSSKKAASLIIPDNLQTIDDEDKFLYGDGDSFSPLQNVSKSAPCYSKESFPMSALESHNDMNKSQNDIVVKNREITPSRLESPIDVDRLEFDDKDDLFGDALGIGLMSKTSTNFKDESVKTSSSSMMFSRRDEECKVDKRNNSDYLQNPIFGDILKSIGIDKDLPKLFENRKMQNKIEEDRLKIKKSKEPSSSFARENSNEIETYKEKARQYLEMQHEAKMTGRPSPLPFQVESPKHEIIDVDRDFSDDMSQCIVQPKNLIALTASPKFDSYHDSNPYDDRNRIQYTAGNTYNDLNNMSSKKSRNNSSSLREENLKESRRSYSENSDDGFQEIKSDVLHNNFLSKFIDENKELSADDKIKMIAEQLINRKNVQSNRSNSMNMDGSKGNSLERNVQKRAHSFSDVSSKEDFDDDDDDVNEKKHSDKKSLRKRKFITERSGRSSSKGNEFKSYMQQSRSRSRGRNRSTDKANRKINDTYSNKKKFSDDERCPRNFSRSRSNSIEKRHYEKKKWHRSRSRSLSRNQFQKNPYRSRSRSEELNNKKKENLMQDKKKERFSNESMSYRKKNRSRNKSRGRSDSSSDSSRSRSSSSHSSRSPRERQNKSKSTPDSNKNIIKETPKHHISYSKTHSEIGKGKHFQASNDGFDPHNSAFSYEGYETKAIDNNWNEAENLKSSGSNLRIIQTVELFPSNSMKSNVEPKSRFNDMSLDEANKIINDNQNMAKHLHVLQNELNEMARQEEEIVKSCSTGFNPTKGSLLQQTREVKFDLDGQIFKIQKNFEDNADKIKAAGRMVQRSLEMNIANKEAVFQDTGNYKANEKSADTDNEFKASSSLKRGIKDWSNVDDFTKSNHTEKKVVKTAGDLTDRYRFEYFDAGNHWCRICNIVSPTLTEHLEHMVSFEHIENRDINDCPWVKDMKSKENKPFDNTKKQTLNAPYKGIDFFLSSVSLYCKLCHVFCGDTSCVTTHLDSLEHNSKYTEYIEKNPNYEKNLQHDKNLAQSVGEKSRQFENTDKTSSKKRNSSSSSRIDKYSSSKETRRDEKVPPVPAPEELRNISSKSFHDSSKKSIKKNESSSDELKRKEYLETKSKDYHEPKSKTKSNSISSDTPQSTKTNSKTEDVSTNSKTNSKPKLEIKFKSDKATGNTNGFGKFNFQKVPNLYDEDDALELFDDKDESSNVEVIPSSSLGKTSFIPDINLIPLPTAPKPETSQKLIGVTRKIPVKCGTRATQSK